jgi:hypothetical protein
MTGPAGNAGPVDDNVAKREPFRGSGRERRAAAPGQDDLNAGYLKTGGASSSGRSGSGTSMRTVLGSTPVPWSIQ